MRLIDADKFKNSFETDCKQIQNFWNDLVDCQPTAYDVDKVVEQLEESDFYIDQEKCITVEDAVNIMKGAVKDE